MDKLQVKKMIKFLLKEYVSKRLLMENKPLDQKTLIEIFEFRYNSTFSKVTNNYEKINLFFHNC